MQPPFLMARRLPSRLLTIALLSSFSIGIDAASAQSAPNAAFDFLTRRDGLSSNNVWAILQDRSGYMWIGTNDGLDRFDGYTVKSFRHDPSDSLSMRSSHVLALHEDEHGRLWIGTSSGPDRLDPGSSRFEHVVLDSTALANGVGAPSTAAFLTGSDGRFWIGTDRGLFVLEDPEGSRVTHYPSDPDDPTSIPEASIQDVLENADGTLWLAIYGGGLTRFDPGTGRSRQYRYDPAASGGLPHDGVWDVHRDRQGRLWVGTRGGLCLMDEATETFNCYGADARDPQSLGDPDVQAILEDNDGRLWLGTASGGVNVFDPEHGVVQRYRHDPIDRFSLAEDDVHVVYRDRFGTFWLGHHNHGVSRMSPNRMRFETWRPDSEGVEGLPANWISALEEGVGGVLWLGTLDGLYRVDPAREQVERYAYFSETARGLGLSGNSVVSMVADQSGDLWIGTGAGHLLVFDRASRTFEQVATPEFDSWVAPGAVDAQGYVWVGTLGAGVWRADTRTRTVRPYLPDSNNAESIAANRTLSHRDASEQVWIQAFERGKAPVFQRYDRERDAFVTSPLSLSPEVYPRHVHGLPDEPGVVWISTADALTRGDLETGSMTRYERREYGLPSEIEALERDAEGRLWFGTWKGEFGVFDESAGTVSYFYGADGVRISRFYHSGRLSSGDFFFVGEGGFLHFDPEDVLRQNLDTSRPIVHVTSLRAAGTELVIPAGGAPLRLNHDQNNLAFDYVGLHFADPTRNRYRFKLEGFDGAWNDAGSQRSALYHRLPPGNYQFRVMAASSNGAWNETGASVSFAILPPWWRTGWAYAFYGLLFIGGVVTTDRVQRRRVVGREREKTRQRELDQAREIEKAYRELQAAQQQLIQQEKMASLGQLTAGIAHEIKNPLNFVTNFAAVARELCEELTEAQRVGDQATVDQIASDLVSNVSKIEEHGRRADQIVRSMMQHARGKAGQREVVHLATFIDEYVNLAYHGKRASTPAFEVDLARNVSEDLGEMALVPQEIGRVLLNLLGNAFDAVHEEAARRDGEYRPRVELSARRTSTHLEIRVADNGPGVPESIRTHIFEPFFTTKEAGKGTGLGLSLSYEVVTQGHDGTLALEDSAEGAMFVVRLPLGASGSA